MKNLTHLLPLLAIVATTACAGQVQDPVNTNPDEGPHAAPPARPDRGDVTGETRWFVVRSLDFGKTSDAWRDLGYDLDGRVTTAIDSKSNARSCQRVEGSPTSILADGNAGIDNAFGGHVYPLLKSLKADFADEVNASIALGGDTLLLRLDGVTGDDNANVTGAVFVARHAEGVAPTYTAGDRFSVMSSSLWDGVDLAKPRFSFPWGYMRGGVWVSGPLQRMDLPLTLQTKSTRFEIPFDRTQLSFRVADGLAGILAGVASEKKLWSEGLEPGFRAWTCPMDADAKKVLAAVADVFTQSADLVDGDDSLQDPTLPCDAMSIGIGFTAAAISAPDAIVAPAAPTPSDCPAPK